MRQANSNGQPAEVFDPHGGVYNGKPTAYVRTIGKSNPGCRDDLIHL